MPSVSADVVVDVELDVVMTTSTSSSSLMTTSTSPASYAVIDRLAFSQ